MLTQYTLLKTLHILAAVAWLGGALLINLYGTRLLRIDRSRVAAFTKDVEWFGKAYFLPLSLLVLVLGALAVWEGHWGFGTLWVVLGIAGIVATALTGSLFLGPESGRIGALIDERGSEDPEVLRRIGRLLAVSRIDLVVLTLIVVDMVMKPT